MPSRAKGRKRSGSGFTVYSSAEPWTLAANPGRRRPPSPARARIAGPITRWLASAASAARPLRDIANRGDVGLQVALSSSSVSWANVLTSKPS